MPRPTNDGEDNNNGDDNDAEKQKMDTTREIFNPCCLVDPRPETLRDLTHTW